MVARSFVCVLVCVVVAAVGFHVEHRASCTRKRLCNGNLMCADVCEEGTVQVDEWATSALAYQRKLQMSSPLVTYQLPGTHNTAVSEAYGYGIEKYFISTLYDAYDTNQGDDVGTGVSQYLTIVDQLRMGLRHIEVDIWWWPSLKDMVVCHSPVPLWPVGDVERKAESQGLNLVWQPLNMSCIGTRRVFVDVLTEIRDWMLENEEEFVVIYIDTKWPITSEQATLGNQHLLDVFGSMLYTNASSNPLTEVVGDLIKRGKRVIVESNKDGWATPSEGAQIVIYPTLWSYQIGSGNFVQFANCSIDGSAAWYGNEMVRALDGSMVEAGTRCGINIVSVDYANPDGMKLFVWSWDQAEPRNTGECVAMSPTSRWQTLDCNSELPYACQCGSELSWTVDLDIVGPWKGSEAPCPSGCTPAVPTNGYINGLLWMEAFAQSVWLNTPTTL